MSRFGIIDIGIMLLTLIVATTFFMPMTSSEKFNYDEADYMFAVSQGFIANYIDSPSIPLFDFINLGFQKGFKDQEREYLSDFIRKSGDISFYRHYHGPYYFYYLSLLGSMVGKDEKVMRQATFIFLLLCYIIVYLGCFFLEERNARFAALISSNLLLFAPSLLYVSMAISPHSMFLPISVASLLLMAKIIQSDDPKKSQTYLLALLFCMALAFLIIENVSFLVVTLFLCYLLQRSSFKDSIFDRKSHVVLFGSIGIFLAIIVLCWPGGLFKLTIFKNYLFHFYHSFGRVDPLNTFSVLKIWKNLFSGSPIDLVIVTFSFISAFYWVLKKNMTYLLPLLIFSALIFLSSTLNKSLNLSVKYISSALPPLYLVTGIVCSHFFTGNYSKIKVIMLTTILSLIFYQNYYFIYKRHQLNTTNKITQIDTLLNYFYENHIVNNKVLLPINFVPTIHYYKPSLDIYSFIYGASDEQIVHKVKNCNCDGLLYIGTNDQNINHLIQSVGIFKKDPLAGTCGKVALTYFKRVQLPLH